MHFWPRLCVVDDICGPLTPWNWWCSGQRPSSALRAFSVVAATVWNRLPANIRTSTCTVQTQFCTETENFLCQPAHLRIFLFFAVEIDSLLLLLLFLSMAEKDNLQSINQSYFICQNEELHSRLPEKLQSSSSWSPIVTIWMHTVLIYHTTTHAQRKKRKT